MISVSFDQQEGFLIANVEISQVINPCDLDRIHYGQGWKVNSQFPRFDQGVVINGKIPPWLVAHLTHQFHPYQWVGIYDPRFAGAVVVTRHVEGAPNIGDVWYCGPDMSQPSEL